MIGKRLELLKETLPTLSRVAVLWHPESRTALGSFTDAQTAARSLAFQVQSSEVRRPQELAKVFASMADSRADALAPVSSNFFRLHRVRIVELAAKHRLPAIFPDKEFVAVGGLMSYGTDSKVLYRRLATYVDRILKWSAPRFDCSPWGLKMRREDPTR